MDMARLVGRQEQSSDIDDLPEARGVLVKCYTEVGSISGWGKVSVDAREVINIDAQLASQFIGVEIETGGDYPQSGIVTIAYKNIDSLIAVLEKLKNIDPNYSKFSHIEASSTIDDLKIIVFNMQKTKMMVSIGTDTLSVNFDLGRIDEFKRLILKAKTVVDQCRAGG